ncbi:DUF5958 family protein [Streptomyces sp. NPDC020801]|uniref:DUF5958 family protein n=1 Tax=unclassified Streptomyces TaxID=2593676 RepID=UPI00378A8595
MIFSEALRYPVRYCIQARAAAEDGPERIRRAGLRPTGTPAALIARGRGHGGEGFRPPSA